MESEITRRKLIGGLGTAAAALSTAACNRSKESFAKLQPGRVNLICHGMMFFLWQDTKDDRDFLKILVPRPPVNPAPKPHEAHKIVLTTSRGGLDSLLFTSGSYRLELGDKGQFTRDKTTVDYSKFTNKKNLVLDTRTLGQNDPPMQDTGKCRYSIRVPFPTDIRRARLMLFTNHDSPYDAKGATVKRFQVDLAELAGTYILTYDAVNTGVILNYLKDLEGTGLIPQTISSDVSQGLNIHLYSEPDNKDDLEMSSMAHSHIERFNELVRYVDDTGAPRELDLKAVNKPDKDDPNQPSDLDADDLKSLYEFHGSRGADPVECLQGWGT